MVDVKKKYGFDPDYAIPPGETLREVIESLGMSCKELAIRTGLTEQSINRILKGDQPITYDTANRLELATGVPASMWNNLEAQYREQLVRIDERERLEKERDWLKEIPLAELVHRRILPQTKDKTLLVREALKFYGVNSVQTWRQVWLKPAVAARRSTCFESRPGPASAWIRMGELQAREINCSPFDKNRFIKALKEIRGLTREEPEIFEPEVRRLCAGAGVAVVLIKEMQKVPWSGATKWLTPQKAMIILSLRGKGEDKFWFSFFHEAGHVLHDSKKELLINDGSHDDSREKKADDFAAEFLISSKYDDTIRRIRSREQIISLAEKLGIAPGIVAGRFQYLTKKWDYFNGLIRKFKWAEK